MKKENRKILGVIGGMGPLATQLFYRMVIERTDAHSDQEHIDMIILNHASMPDRTEAILSGNVEPVCSRLLEDAELLAGAGADFIAVPCNTSHYMLDMLGERFPVPYIHMMEVAADKVAGLYPNGRVGILATDGTNRAGLYFDALTARGLSPVVPSEDSQRILMSIIYDGIKDGGDIDFESFRKIEAELAEKGADCALLACTELSCFKEMANLSEFYIDAMEALAEKAVLLCGKELKDGK